MSVIREDMMLGGLGAMERETCGAEKPSSSVFVAMALLDNVVVGIRPPRDGLTAVRFRN
jgi:hypothetical protein